jgi:hypothetical protein
MVPLSEQCRKEHKEHSKSIKSACTAKQTENREVEDWNKIPSWLKSAKTMRSFKNGYAHLRAKMVENTRHGAGSIKIECVDHTLFSQTLAKGPYLSHCESTSKYK